MRLRITWFELPVLNVQFELDLHCPKILFLFMQNKNTAKEVKNKSAKKFRHTSNVEHNHPEMVFINAALLYGYSISQKKGLFDMFMNNITGCGL
jgi:hypothetical protein